MAAKPAPPSKRSSSLRHTLNFSSVGKALADVISKDDKSKNRRVSAVRLPATVATSDVEFGGQRTPTPTDAFKTVTRATARRSSSAIPRHSISSDESSARTLVETGSRVAAAPQAPRLSTSLRPTTRSQTASAAAASGLPKPKGRPKSTISEASSKASSPKVRTTEDDKGSRNDPQKGMKKPDRAVSPVPHRGALKVNLTAAFNITPTKSSGTRDSKRPASKDASPKHPKSAKGRLATSASGIPRPSSARSMTSSPRTPKTPLSAKSSREFKHGREAQSQPSTPSRGSPYVTSSGSPMARRPGRHSGASTPTSGLRRAKGSDSPIMEENSEDDVVMLLAPSAAPTPFMPRAIPKCKVFAPQTPPRASLNLPGRDKLSYPSPARRPSGKDSGSLLSLERPGVRGSILSWEQITKEHSKSLDQDELEKMLSDVPAPFQDGPASPPPSAPRSPLYRPRANLDVPESPALSLLSSSAGGFGSISHVLLPDVTPSPPVHAVAPLDFYIKDAAASDPDAPAVDAAIVTLLRLQLASAESIAQDRANQLQLKEGEIRSLKETRAREAADLAQQMSELESKLRENLEFRQRSEEEKVAHIASLEDQLRHSQGFHEEAIRVAVEKAQAQAQASLGEQLRRRQRKWQLACAVGDTVKAWSAVHDLADSELELVHSNRQMLSVLLTVLDQKLSA